MRTEPGRRVQWLQLAVLTLGHGIADTVGGCIPAILPALRERHGLSLAMGVALLTVLNLSCNVLQIPFGRLAGTRTSPAWFCGGLLLTAGVALLAWVVPGPSALPQLAGLMLLCGAGIAAVHPDGLRGVHRLHRLPASLATSIFMVGGFAGFAAGAWIAAALVEAHGLRGLAWLALGPLIAAALIPLARIQLVAEAPAGTPAATPARTDVPALPLVPLFVVATLVCTAAATLAAFLPSYLRAVGRPLTAGGSAVMLFGVGGAAGALYWSTVAQRRGYVRTLVGTLLAGAPVMAAYFLLAARRPAALGLLVVGGFLAYAAYPLIVTLTRYAATPMRLGSRMGLIVGGVWGTASLAVLALGPLAERFGIGPVLHTVWICYLAAALVARHRLRAAP